MMNKQNTVIAPKGANYLSEFMAELPYNGLFNKGLTGCGATELALTNNVPTIVVMPYVALVENKANKPNREIPVLGVSGDTTIAQICTFAENNKNIKIASTYDSLPKVIKALESIGIAPYKELFLLIDE